MLTANLTSNAECQSHHQSDWEELGKGEIR